MSAPGFGNESFEPRMTDVALMGLIKEMFVYRDHGILMACKRLRERASEEGEEDRGQEGSLPAAQATGMPCPAMSSLRGESSQIPHTSLSCWRQKVPVQ